MKHIALFVWCVASIGLWLLVGFLFSRFAYWHVSFEIPLWLKDAITWAIHLFSPGYSPDALDIEDVCALLLIIAAHLLTAVVVVPASVIAWRRIRRSPY